MQVRNKQDELIFKEAPKSYGWLNIQDNVVMDIGLNIGAFTRMALDRGAKKIVSYEPEIENYRYATLNCIDERAELINAAIVSGKEEFIKLYTTTSRKNCGNFSTQQFRGRIEVEVSARNFLDELNRVKPSILKIDCEGAEYDFLTDPLPEFVKEVAIEIHLTKKIWRMEKAQKLIDLFAGWEIIKTPVIGEKNWYTIGGFKRL